MLPRLAEANLAETGVRTVTEVGNERSEFWGVDVVSALAWRGIWGEFSAMRLASLPSR